MDPGLRREDGGIWFDLSSISPELIYYQDKTKYDSSYSLRWFRHALVACIKKNAPEAILAAGFRSQYVAGDSHAPAGL